MEPQSGYIIVRNRPADHPTTSMFEVLYLSVHWSEPLQTKSCDTQKYFRRQYSFGTHKSWTKVFLDTINATLGSILDFLGKLKIWQVPTCKMEPQSGSIIIVRHWHADRSTGQPMTGQPSDIINVWGPVSQVLLIRACPNNVLWHPKVYWEIIHKSWTKVFFRHDHFLLNGLEPNFCTKTFVDTRFTVDPKYFDTIFDLKFLLKPKFSRPEYFLTQFFLPDFFRPISFDPNHCGPWFFESISFTRNLMD